MAPAGRPVLAILPPGNLKLRFFVPGAVLPQIAYGDPVTVHCDGCAGDITARVSFISRTAEFTPPVIFSLQERSKLVFLIEALPDNPEKLRVGQPIDVALGGNADAPAQAGFPAEREREGMASRLRNWALSLLGADGKAPGKRE
jgi:HlyD family secretion protein